MLLASRRRDRGDDGDARMVSGWRFEAHQDRPSRPRAGRRGVPDGRLPLPTPARDGSGQQKRYGLHRDADDGGRMGPRRQHSTEGEEALGAVTVVVTAARPSAAVAA
jgi:hypothetical protein